MFQFWKSSTPRAASRPRGRAAAAAMAAFFAGSAMVAEAAEQLLVPMDEARVVRLNRGPASVIVGNPLIAGVTVHDEKLLVVVGKAFGTTNIIALDDEGKELSNFDVSVRTGGNHAVQVYYGGARMSYTCAPRCERRLEIGDDVTKFEELNKQTGDKIGLSNGAAQ